MNDSAIVLCGGKSSRMGSSKAMLPFGEERMLQRVVRVVSSVVGKENVVVVAAPGQQLPSLASEVTVAYDQQEGRGPLEGLAAGLEALGDRASAAFATSCDVPLLTPQFVERMFELLGDHDIGVPQDGKFHHPLAACYRISVLKSIQGLLAADRLRPVFLFDEVKTRKVPVDELREVDPELASLTNLNTPEDYLAALAVAGLPVSPEWQARC